MEQNVLGPNVHVLNQMNNIGPGMVESPGSVSTDPSKDPVIESNLKSTFPTVIVDLPSKGLFYPEGHPLKSGKIEMKYMTAKEEDILTTESYIKNGIVFDKLFQSLIVTPFDYDTLLIGDKDAVMIAARIYGYGENYPISVKSPSGKDMDVKVNLKDLKNKEINEESIVPGKNLFTFQLPLSEKTVEFKILTVRDQRELEDLSKKYKKPGAKDPNITNRLIQQIVSIDGNSDKKYIQIFVNEELRAIDSMALRKFMNSVVPGVDMEIELIDPETEEPFRTKVTPGLDFFWPDI